MFWDDFSIIRDEMKYFEEYLQGALTSSQSLIQEAISGLRQAGGKRIRPALVIASAHFGGDYDQKQVLSVATAVEILHMATLVHGDIIDDSNLRRGVKTVQSKYSKDIAVFTGDYLFSLTFDVLSGKATNDQLKKVVKVIKRICEGEVQQYQERYNFDISYKDYLKRTKGKTALLFESSCVLGAGIADLSKLNIRRLAHYGRYLGMAFQLIDDVFDFKKDTQEIGKPDANDFTQGIYTLPILYAISETEYVDQLRLLLEDPIENSQKIKEIVVDSGGLEYTLNIANNYIKKAKDKIDKLPTSDYRQVLLQLADRVINREF